jgi:hypothetical protein
MAKREKSKKLYGLLLVGKAEKRDKMLSELLDTDYQPESIGVPTYLSGSISSFGFTHQIEYIKTWKTLAGVERFKSLLIQEFVKNPTEVIHLHTFDIVKYMEEGLIWITGFEQVPYSSISVQIVEITDAWNIDIEKKIDREHQRHKNELRKLENLKVI